MTASLPAPSRHPAAPRGLAVLLLLSLLASGCKPMALGGPTPAGDVSGTVATGGACFTPPSITAGAPTGAPADWTALPASNHPECFQMSAAKSDSAGVAVDTAFNLGAKDALKPEEVAQHLVVMPDLAFAVQAVSDSAAPTASASATTHLPNQYQIVPKAPLEPGQVYHFAMLSAPQGQPVQTWSFQAHQPLTVVQTLPADQSAGVPLDTGIEVTFNLDGVTGVESKVTFDPPVTGTWEMHKRTAAFVPKALTPNTLYTVTVAPGVAVAGSDVTMKEPATFRFETGTSTRAGQPPAGPTLGFAREIWESATADAPVLAMYGLTSDGNQPNVGELPFSVFRYQGPTDFLAAFNGAATIPTWAQASRSDHVADTKGLAPATTFSATPQAVGQGGGDLLVTFPAPLAAGYYLVQTTWQDKPVQTWLQVTDLAPYLALSQTKTLVWVNDIVGGGPLAGANVTAVGNGAFKATTGADGTALVATPAELVTHNVSPYGYASNEASGNLLVTAPDGRTAVVPLTNVLANQSRSPFRGFGPSGDASLYWRYIYTDRHLYHPTDTLHFWGLVRSREAPAKPEQLTIELSNSEFQDYYYRPAVLSRTQVTTQADGTFIGNLDFEGASPGYYQLQVKRGDSVIASTYAEVREFVKPAYKIDVAASKPAVFVGDKLDLALATSFFEGSPVPGVVLNYTGLLSGTLKTDDNGHASLPYTAKLQNPNDVAYQPYDLANLIVTPRQPEEGDISGLGTVMVFRSALDVQATGEAKDGQSIVKGVVFNVDPSQATDVYSGSPATYRSGPAAGRAVQATVTALTWDRKVTGQSYDYVSKTVQPIYQYDQVRTPVGTFPATTGSDGAFSVTFPVDADKGYEVNLKVTDDAGRSYTTQTSVSGTATNYPGDTSPTLDGGADNRYLVGQPVTVSMKVNNALLPTGQGNSYLFMQAQNGIRDIKIQSDPTNNFTFEDADVPNIAVLGVRWNGHTFQEAGGGYTAQLDRKARQLQVQVTPAQPGYKPGDDAVLNVAITNLAGKPAAAQVLLSAVDEAIYRLQGPSFYDDLGILNSLYESVPSGVIQTYASHQVPLYSGGAEGGGGGGGRSDFKDTALFQQVATDATGKAQVHFKLPDNLTSWRVSALAVTDDLFAGSGTGAVPVSLPVFVDATLAQSYLTSDKPVLRLRAYGTALKPGDTAQFTVTSKTLLDQPLTAQGPVFTGINVPLPALKDGQHTLTIHVDAAGKSDALDRTISVVPSRLAQAETAYAAVAEGQTWSPTASGSGATNVYLTDSNRGRYYPTLQSLAWTGGDRLDQMLARNHAQALLAQYFQQTPALPATFDVSAYQTQGGGLAVLPFGDADLTLSARVADVDPRLVGQQSLAQYFRGVIDKTDQTRERVIIALYGLAAIGEPVLPQVQALAKADDLTWREQLYLGLAAAALGDVDTASRLYHVVLAKNGQARGDSVRLNVGTDQDDVLEATSLGAILGARLADETAPLLFNYTVANATKDVPVDLNQISYLSAVLPHLPGAAVKASYSLGGQRETVELKPGEGQSLQLSAADLAKLDLKADAGTVGVTSGRVVPLDAATVQKDPELTLTRTYPGRADPVGISADELVRIALDYSLGAKAVDGCYEIDDLLPSGLFPVVKPWERGVTDENVAVPYKVDGQRVSFCVNKSGPKSPAVYYARVTGTGSYSAEPALLQAQAAPESKTVTAPLAVDIH